MTATDVRPLVVDLLAQAEEDFGIADYEGVLRTVDQLLKFDPSNRRAQWIKALTLYRKGRWSEAIFILKGFKHPDIEETIALGWSHIFLSVRESSRAESDRLRQDGLNYLVDVLTKWARDCRGDVPKMWKVDVRSLRRRGFDEAADELERLALELRKTPPPRPRQLRGKKRQGRHGGRS